MSNEPSIEQENTLGFPGEELKEARESKGLTTADVSSAISMSRNHIEALEAGDFTALPTRVFVLGYIKSYARFLELPEEPFLASYNDFAGFVKPVPGVKVSMDTRVRMDNHTQKSHSPKKGRFFVNVLLILLVAGVAAGVWLKRDVIVEFTRGGAVSNDSSLDIPASLDGAAEDESTNEESNNALALPDLLGASSEEAPVEQNSLELDVTALTEVSEESVLASVPQLPDITENVTVNEPGATLPEVPAVTNIEPAIKTVVEAPDNSVELSRESETPVERVSDASEQTSSERVSNEIVEAALNVSAQLTSQAEVATGESQNETAIFSDNTQAVTEGHLRIIFNDDCWTEVRDAAGRVLVASIRNAERGVDVTGVMPIRVTLGALSAVNSVSFNGDNVSIDPEGRSNILRLTLPSAE